jgi:hypothetical protein
VTTIDDVVPVAELLERLRGEMVETFERQGQLAGRYSSDG